MVQRYEQMRRLQWYKRGAAYRFSVIPHDFSTCTVEITQYALKGQKLLARFNRTGKIFL